MKNYSQVGSTTSLAIYIHYLNVLKCIRHLL